MFDSETNNSKTLLIVVNVDWIFLSHRIAIGEAAVKNGYRVIVATKDSGKADLIRAKGMEFVPLPISRSGTQPIKELMLLWSFYKLYKKVQPDLIHHITLKPVIYGSVVAKVIGLKTVNAISGLGYSFTDKRKGLLQKVLVSLMKYGFSKRDNHLIFQNKDDLKELKSLGIISNRTAISIIKGVGVDLETYRFEHKKKEIISVVMPSRMLWDKGVKEFVEAAKLLKEKYFGQVQFNLYGKIDKENKMGVLKSYLENQEIEGYLKWYGHQEDMLRHYVTADIVVLPSYREGIPRTLIEACAAGLPIVTTTAIGCRDCVDEGENGYKVPVKSVIELAEAIEKLILSPEDRIRMGQNSRKKAEHEFDQKEVIKKHLQIYDSMIQG